MAITHVNSQSGTEAAATSVTATKPTGTASGDLLLAFFSSNSQACTPPAGWTLLTDETTEVFRLQAYYKVAGGSEPASYSFSVGAAAPLVLSITALRGVDTGDVFDSSVGIESALTHSEPYTTPSVTADSAGRLLYFRAVRASTTTPFTFTASGVSELRDVGVFSGGSVSYSQGIYLATSDYSTSGSKSGLAITCSGTESHNIVFTLAIKSSGVTGDSEMTLPLPTMSASGYWSYPATLETELPLPDVSVDVFHGEYEAVLDGDVNISVAFSGNTPVRGPMDVVIPLDLEFGGETRRFAENIVEVVREERWLIITQDGYRPGVRNVTFTRLTVDLPLLGVSFAVKADPAAPPVSADVVAEGAHVGFSFSAGSTSASVAASNATVAYGDVGMSEDVVVTVTANDASIAMTTDAEHASALAEGLDASGTEAGSEEVTASVTAYNPTGAPGIHAFAGHAAVSCHN